jgi:hypothetical protein
VIKAGRPADCAKKGVTALFVFGVVICIFLFTDLPGLFASRRMNNRIIVELIKTPLIRDYSGTAVLCLTAW